MAAVLLCVCWALAVPAADTSVPYVQAKGRARATAEGGTVRDGAVQVPLSETLTITLAVEGGPRLEVAALQNIAAGEAWIVPQPPAPPRRTPLPAGRMRWEQSFTAEPAKPGEANLPLPPLRYRESPDAAWQTIQWDDVPVRVTTDVSSADLKELRDILPPERPPALEHWPWWPFLAGGLLMLGATAPVVWLLQRRKPQAPPPLPAHAWAAAELDRLEALDLPARGELNRYHTLLSDVVRRYLELRFQLHAPRQTTAEFLKAVQSATQLAPAQQDLLREFLGRCDLAKFAGASPTPDECRTTADMARSFVEQTGAISAPAEPVP
jgi:hypothetical protein